MAIVVLRRGIVYNRRHAQGSAKGMGRWRCNPTRCRTRPARSAPSSRRRPAPATATCTSTTPSAFRRRGRARACRPMPASPTTGCLQQRIGTTRTVVVQPRDLRHRQSPSRSMPSPGSAERPGRGGGVSRRSADTELQSARWPAGVRGIRFSCSIRPPRSTTHRHDRAARAAHRRPRLARADPHARRPDRRQRRPAAAGCPRPIVIDHMGRLAAPRGHRASRLQASSASCVDKGHDLGQAVGRLPGHQDRPADLRRRHGAGAGLRRRRHPSAWSGAATGRIRPRRTSPTMRCCSTC